MVRWSKSPDSGSTLVMAAAVTPGRRRNSGSRRAKKAERLVGALFILSLLASIGFIAAYVGLEVGTVDSTLRSNLALGLSMSVAFLAVAVVASLQFKTANFHAGGGFMPFGFHGVFAALTGGVVFGLQGFEQAVQLAGEARDPKKDISRSILTAMAIGAVLYTLLQIVMIGGLNPGNILTGWSKPLGTDPSDFGAWYTIALAVGAAWLMTSLSSSTLQIALIQTASALPFFLLALPAGSIGDIHTTQAPFVGGSVICLEPLVDLRQRIFSLR